LGSQRILIFGRDGQVGWELRHKLACLGQISAVGLPEVDFARPDSIREAVRTHEPAVIVNAAAYTAVDKAESEPELARAINATGPGLLAEEARRLGALLIHYSTDYVFDGTKQNPWVETDEANPLGVYGRTKLEGDRAIEASACDHLIFRTSWVYGARGKRERAPGDQDCGRPDRLTDQQRMHRPGNGMRTGSTGDDGRLQD